MALIEPPESILGGSLTDVSFGYFVSVRRAIQDGEIEKALRYQAVQENLTIRAIRREIANGERQGAFSVPDLDRMLAESETRLIELENQEPGADDPPIGAIMGLVC